VLSLPKRLRYFLQREPAAVSAVLHIILRVIEQTLKRHAGEVGPGGRIGAVSFIHRFGGALTTHVHLHLCVIEAVFEPGVDGTVQVHEVHLPEEALAQAQQLIRRRVLRWFTRQGWLEEADRQEMLRWAGGGGFSLDGSVRIEAEDRAGLERLLRYCARPPFALERLEAVGEDRLVYHLPKPRPDGQTELVLTPLELIDKLVALIPPPRVHRHRYHGVLAPNSPVRTAVTALAHDSDAEVAVDEAPQAPTPVDPAPPSRSPARYLWAALIARIYEIWPLTCSCGAPMRLITFITEREPVERILSAIGEPTQPPRLAPARGPPQPSDSVAEPIPAWDELAQPTPEFDFDQTVSW
jgi:hypothetical protein